MLEEKMLQEKVWAVVGANQNPEKYGNMIYRKLKRKGYQVYAVNPRYDKIDDDPCYASLSDLPQKVAVVNMVVTPKIGRGFIEEAIRLQIPYIWFQPGTYSDELGDFAEKSGLQIVQACALVATR
ncbi:MAG: CoA-binding protein [Bacillota bacterium]|nr:CoA-binding protein [Bacillota bacterium]